MREKVSGYQPQLPEWYYRYPLFKNREIVRPDGTPSFEILWVPEEEAIPIERVFLATTGETFTLLSELKARKEIIISQRIITLESIHQAALRAWEQADPKTRGEEPPPPLFYDGPVVRVHPDNIVISRTAGGEEEIIITGENTTYFAYVATRDLPLDRYSYDDMALPLAMRGVLTTKDRTGAEHLIYTVRTTKPESYQGYFHVPGGILANPEWDLAHPTLAWKRELLEEAGIKQDEVENIEVVGAVMDAYWLHPEITHIGRLNVPLEDIFDRDGVSLTPKRDTDKEVEFRCIPWKENIVRALILGERVAGGDQDIKPWVPTGLANLLLVGRESFGEKWYDETMQEYTDRISYLNIASVLDVAGV